MDRKKNNKSVTPKPQEPVFRDILKSMDDFFSHSPLKNIVRQMDDFFTHAIYEHSISIETTETDDEFIIISKLPGVNKNQITIESFDKYLTISVKHEESTETTLQNKWSSKSMAYSHTTRTIPVPPYVKTHQLKANYQNGLLKITIPKKQRKKYEIEG